MICDYEALNKITVLDSNLLPLIDEALDQVAGVTIFSQIDLIGAFHHMQIREEDCPRTAIRTRFGSLEWRVLCFGLTNALASFSRLFSTLLRQLNGECLVLFLDEFLVYSESIEKHRVPMLRFFEILQTNKLFARSSKCSIGASEVNFVGYRANKKGIYMQMRLMDAKLDWPAPKSVNEVRHFVDLANFCRWFIKKYAMIMQSISDIIRFKQFTRS